MRYFVGPGSEALNGASGSGVCPISTPSSSPSILDHPGSELEGEARLTIRLLQLKPYVSTLVPHTRQSTSIPSFSPTLPKTGLTVPSPSTPSGERTLRTAQQYSRWYWSRTEDERQWDIQQARRRWWGGMSEHLSEKRGDKTKEVERQVQQGEAGVKPA